MSLDKSCGGPSRSLPTMCLGLKKINVYSDILTYQSEDPNVDVLRKNGFNLFFVKPERGVWNKYFSTSFVKSVMPGIDLIHIHNLWSWPLHCISRFAYKNAIPVVWSPRGTLEPWSLKQKKIKKKLALSLYQKVDLENACCIHATAAEEAINIRKLGFKNPMAVIPNGINILNYPLKLWTRKEKKVLAFLSRIHPKKGIELLLDAWSKIPLEILSSWRIEIAGEGEPEYVKHLNHLLLTKFVNFDIKLVGPKYGENKIKFLHQADLFILPTFSENFGMAIAEAMACGVPVITTTGTPWIELKEQGAGWFVDSQEDALVKVLIEALKSDQDLLEEKGKKCRQIILNKYTIEAVSDDYKLLYEWVVNPICKKPSFIV